MGDERGHNCPIESEMMMMRVEQSNVGEDEARVAESGEWSEWLSEQQCGWVKAFLRTFWGTVEPRSSTSAFVRERGLSERVRWGVE